MYEVAGTVAGYIIFHPAKRGWVAPLDPLEEQEVARPTCYYVHDLAVDPAWRGKGVAAALFEEVVEGALEEDLHTIALVAVQDAEGFWKRLGFKKKHDLVYGGAPAAYMVKRL